MFSWHFSSPHLVRRQYGIVLEFAERCIGVI